MKKVILSHAIALVIGAAVCMYFDKEVHEVKKEVVYKDRIKTVVKEVITEKPDGSKTTERTIEKDEKSDKQVSEVEKKPVEKKWIASMKHSLFAPEPIITAEIQRRVIGDIFVGAYGTNQGAVGVSLSIMF